MQYLKLVSLYIVSILILTNLNVIAKQKVQVDSLTKGLQQSTSEEDNFYFLEELYYYWLNINYDSAEVYANKYYQYAIRTSNPKNESIGLNYKGIVFDYRGDVPKALEYYNQALEIRKLMGDDRLIANSLSNIGALYYHAGDYTNASDYYFDALEIREVIQDSSGLSQSYNNIGILLKNQGEIERALDYYLRSAELKKEIGREHSAMFTMMNIGSLYIQLKEYESAISISEDALSIAIKYQDVVSAAALKLNIGSALSSLKRFDEAEKLLLTGIEEIGSVGEVANEIEGYTMLINNYYQQGRLSKAKEYIRLLSSRENEFTEPSIAQQFYAVAVNVYKADNNFKEAFSYKVKEAALKDSLFNESTKNALLELETKYQLSQKQQELEILNSENTLKQVQIDKANIVRNFTIFVALLLIVVLIIGFRNYKVRVQLNKKLQKNLDEKEVLMKEIHHRVKNNLQIISSLLSIQSREVAGNESATLALKESKNRVQSMALIHQRLYQKESITGVKVDDYIGQLVETLITSFGIENRVHLNLDIQTLNLDVDTAIPLGLIINELITNSVKYAFNDIEQGELSVLLKEIDNSLHLQISDNGKGFSKNNSKASFGMSLVKMLSKKLNATLTFSNNDGTDVKLEIKNYKKAS